MWLLFVVYIQMISKADTAKISLFSSSYHICRLSVAISREPCVHMCVIKHNVCLLG